MTHTATNILVVFVSVENLGDNNVKDWNIQNDQVIKT